jgi:hypothetical protein
VEYSLFVMETKKLMLVEVDVEEQSLTSPVVFHH